MKRYEQTLARNEIRWLAPPSQAVIDETIDAFQASGVDGWVCSGVSQECVPLFPSRVYPSSHPDANDEWLPYLLARAREAGITVISWYSLNHSRSVAERFPEYRMRFLDGPFTPPADPDHTFLCVNSPHLDLLTAFSVELIEAGFQGIWFDGNTISRHGVRPVFQPGCHCAYCEERFHRDTGLPIPREVDFDHPAFRRWLAWRYEILVKAWTRITAAVRGANPDATVCLNNYRRRGGTWTTGIPLKRLGLDVLMSGELDGFVAQADFQMKMHQAMGCGRGTESWIPMTHYWDMWRGNPEPITMAQGALGAVCAGGNVFCGTGNLDSVRGSMPEIVRRVAPLHPHLGGEMTRYAGIWVSQQCQDWIDKLDPTNHWNAWHGANELLNHAHLQSGVVLDDMLDQATLSDFPVIIAGANSCVSDRQMAELMNFARGGGLLVACGQFGVNDELGSPREQHLLHEFLGIRTVHQEEEFAYGSLDERYRPAGLAGAVFAGYRFERIERTADHADVVTVAMTQREPHVNDSPGVVLRPCGQGAVVYFNSDVFAAYASTPIRWQMELVAGVLRQHARPRINVQGPMAVTVNMFAREDGYVIFLHNNPGPAYRYPNGGAALGEVSPAHDIDLDLSGLGVTRAVLASTGQPLPLVEGRVHLARLDYADALILS